jgi:hypothetical protein
MIVIKIQPRYHLTIHDIFGQSDHTAVSGESILT